MTEQWKSMVLLPTDADCITVAKIEVMIEYYRSRPIERLRPWPMGRREAAWWQAHPDLWRQMFGP